MLLSLYWGAQNLPGLKCGWNPALDTCVWVGQPLGLYLRMPQECLCLGGFEQT